MNSSGFRYIYGPVPSRRLGRSLGVDLVPFKTCTYDCIYCQLGRTTCKTIERKEYVPIAEILVELQQKLTQGAAPDFVTLAGSGEPTLYSEIGKLLREIKRLTSVPVAILTNGSLLWMREVQDALLEADLVLPSLDAGDERSFRRVNRPPARIGFEKVVSGIAEFTDRFHNPVWLEVFLVAEVTGVASEVERIATLTARIHPERVQLNTVWRPPAEAFAHPVPAEQMEVFAGLFDGNAEVISEQEAGESQPRTPPTVTDDDILALLGRRPCTARGVSTAFGLHIAETTKRLQSLVQQGSLSPLRKNKGVFYAISRGPAQM
jgi:wyosine [tRNA(Phe)-imidazoG37] synthetase (radical SAM superfamily)